MPLGGARRGRGEEHGGGGGGDGGELVTPRLYKFLIIYHAGSLLPGAMQATGGTAPAGVCGGIRASNNPVSYVRAQWRSTIIV